jgi:methyl-accepting chemotaxis protein
MKIIMIGGGNAAVALLKYFSTLQDAEVGCVVDLRGDAPAILLAREMGIDTSDDMEEAVNRADSEVVIEVTGSTKVSTALREMMRPEQQLMNSGCARMMIDMIESQSQANATVLGNISGEFQGLTEMLGGAIGKVDSALRIIRDVLREMQIVTLNANIEAARAGNSGWAFLKVVERMREMLKRTGEATDSITAASGESHKALEDLSEAESRMQEVFKVEGDGKGKKRADQNQKASHSDRLKNLRTQRRISA